ncbi:zinc finger MYM-type protein 1-like [Palaemon carinicauda]|uniref:zinc finger MYM-type protein 1-like n=1 Tax=Palaemon carinicauda TaxID=392227 RepID=UPI0035B57866
MLTKTVSDVTSTVESADTSDHTGSPPSIISQPASTSLVSPLNVTDISSTGFVLKDLASWPNVIPDSLRNAFIAENFSQTLNIDFRKSARIYDDGNRRCLKSSMFYRKLENSETVKRSWMVYSESSGKVYCSACKLFSTNKNAFTQGFNDWKNSKRFEEHENSTTHRNCILASVFRAQKKGLLDSHLENQTEKERTYWRKVLERVVAVVKFLALRGLAFRGENEVFGSENNGNFLGIIELLAQFDPFLANHVSRLGNAGRGTVSYMSSTICNEFIELMTKKVLKNIIAAVITAKYFTISVDSTPDISHTDQLTFIVRFVDSSGKPVERFIKLIPLSGHDGETMMNVVLDTLLEHDLSIMDCRGQSYDNASNMSGKYNGLQARIKQINPLAEYVPCSAHSLNLVGSCAAECCVAAVSFFGLLQALFNFFSASTHRWSILKSTIHGDVIKSLSTTRWSAQHDATHALKDSFAEIRSALIQIAEDEDQTATTRSEAASLASKLEDFELALLCVLWDCILERLNATNKTLQKTEIEMATCANLYAGLVEFVISLRNDEAFEMFEEKAKLLVKDYSYRADHQRSRKRKRNFEEPDNEILLLPRQKCKTATYFVILDSLITELVKRKEIYLNLNDKFGFLFKITTMPDAELREAALKLQQHLSADVQDTFVEEIVHFSGYMNQIKAPPEKCAPSAALKHLRNAGISEAFPNVDIAYRLYLTLPATNCEGERSFSVLKRVKNQLRSTMSQDKLCNLALLTIESDLTRNIDFQSIIDDFANMKSRKKFI